jgi:hypothetical protein
VRVAGCRLEAKSVSLDPPVSRPSFSHTHHSTSLSPLSTSLQPSSQQHSLSQTFLRSLRSTTSPPRRRRCSHITASAVAVAPANTSPEGTLNAAYNCLDRHFYANPDKTAIIYEADEASESREISFRELMKETCQIANVLKSWGIKKGDAVSI